MGTRERDLPLKLPLKMILIGRPRPTTEPDDISLNCEAAIVTSLGGIGVRSSLDRAHGSCGCVAPSQTLCALAVLVRRRIRPVSEAILQSSVTELVDGSDGAQDAEFTGFFEEQHEA